MTRLTVIIPIFRAKPYIEETIASVILQCSTLQAVEVLVVDNHCDDGSVGIAMDMLANAGVDCRLLSEPIPGPGMARNCGLKHARGEWIQFLDADDILFPAKSASQLAFAEGVGSSVAFIYSSWGRGQVPSSLDRIIDSTLSKSGPELMLDLIGERGFLPLACGLIRRSAVQSIGGFEEGLIEDVRLQLKLVDAGFHFEHMPLDQPGFFYRKVNTSLSNSNHTNFWTGVVNNALFVYDRLVAQTWKFEERSPIQCALASAALALSTKSMPSAQWALDIAKSRGINLVAGFPNKYAQVARLVGIKRMLQLAYTYRWLRRKVGL